MKMTFRRWMMWLMVFMAGWAQAETYPAAIDEAARVGSTGAVGIWNYEVGDSGGTIQSGVAVFELPTLPSDETISAAHFKAYLSLKSYNCTFNGDLYAVRVSTSPTVLASDYYTGAFFTSSGSQKGLQDNFLTSASSASHYAESSASADATLGSWLASEYDPNGGTQYVFIRISADVANSSQYYRLHRENDSNPPVLTVTTGVSTPVTPPSGDVTVHEDAEDGNTDGWHVYTSTPGVIANVADPNNSADRVIKFTGTETSTGYRYYFPTSQTDKMIIEWDMKYSESYVIYISCQTTQGHRYIYYTPATYDALGTDGYIHHGLGSGAMDGQWHTIQRDLLADLHDAQPGNDIISVDAFLLRGSGLIDNIQSVSETVALPPPPAGVTVHENAEDGDTAGWHVYTSTPGAIANVVNPDNSTDRVIQFTGTETSTGYRYYFPTSQTEKMILEWDMKYSENYVVYISCQTTLGHRYIYYTPATYDALGADGYIHHGLGSATTDGQWHTIQRDLLADLHDAQPGNDIISVDAFLLRGSGLMDNIQSLSATVEPPSGGDPKEVQARLDSILDVWSSGTTRVRWPNAETRVGRPNSSYLSAGVIAFELPSLNGAAVTSATLKFSVNSASYMNSSTYANLNVDALRSAASGSSILATDFNGIGLGSGQLSIQANAATWEDSFPGDYETSAPAGTTLGNWLNQQYTKEGVGGLVFLRLTPSRDPVANRYMSLSSSSVELILTTDGNEDPVRGLGNSVSVQMGSSEFSWTFNKDVEWGYFVDGQPWIVRPSTGVSLVSATPARLNNQSVRIYKQVGDYPSVTADINITVRNPPLDHTFDGVKYVNNPNGVFGWDSRAGWAGSMSPKYNPTLGWNGTSSLALSAGDSITTPQSITGSVMLDRATPLEALAVLTVLNAIPPEDAFRPGVIRTGTDRTNPEIIRYSDVINLTPYLIPTPIGKTDLSGSSVSSIATEYTFNHLQQLLPGPSFLNTGLSPTEGASARYNNSTFLSSSSAGSYGGRIGNRMGNLAIGSLASWLTPEERKFCQIRYIQRAIDSYSAIKAGLCMEEGAGILPGYSTLITTAGVMLNHSGMKGVNSGVNGVKPWFVFADYATCFHTGVPTSELASGEAWGERLVSLYDTSSNRPELNKKNIQPVASSTANTATMQNSFYWGNSRPMENALNLKVKITSGAGAGSTLYVITKTEGFRTSAGTAHTVPNGYYGYEYGGKVTVKPNWVNGWPNSSSIMSFSITTSKPGSSKSDDGQWFWGAHGVLSHGNPVTFEKVLSVCTAPLTEGYASIHTGGTIDNLIALYSLGQQGLYKGGLDQYMIDSGKRPGHGEKLFNGVYFAAMNPGSTRGALWKQEVLTPTGNTFSYTGNGIDSLPIPDTDAKMWYEN